MMKTNYDDRCTILINSCDSYSDVWEPFFNVFKNTWPNCKLPIVLNTETKSFQFKELNIKTLNLLPGKNKEIAWGERIIDVLRRIDTKYVLFLLEDFFFEEKVKDNVIEQCIEWMEKDEEIVSFLFVTPQQDSFEEESHKYPGFCKRKQKGYYKMNACPGLWNRKRLIELTEPQDSPWQWEFFGSVRTWKYPGLFYCKAPTAEEIFKYDCNRGGAVHRGKWVGCTVRPILNKVGITVDFSERGIIEDWTKEPEYKKRNWKAIIPNKVLFIKSYLKGYKYRRTYFDEKLRGENNA